jgi:OOP family OmpA-OmpF porin
MTLGIEFDTDKADIMAQYHNEIAKLGEYMEKCPTTKANIEGNTDNVGNNGISSRNGKNRTLSKQTRLWMGLQAIYAPSSARLPLTSSCEA